MELKNRSHRKNWIIDETLICFTEGGEGTKKSKITVRFNYFLIQPFLLLARFNSRVWALCRRDLQINPLLHKMFPQRRESGPAPK